MTTRRNQSSTFRRGPRRATDWAFGLASAALVTVPANSSVLAASSSIGSLESIVSATLIRTRGTYGIQSDQKAVSTQEQQIGALGICVVNEASLAGGVGNIPTPLSDFLWDGWLWIETFQYTLEIGDVAVASPEFMHSRPIDSKAMRKFESDVGIALVVENDHATHGFQLGFGIRFLFKAG